MCKVTAHTCIRAYTHMCYPNLYHCPRSPLVWSSFHHSSQHRSVICILKSLTQGLLWLNSLPSLSHSLSLPLVSEISHLESMLEGTFMDVSSHIWPFLTVSLEPSWPWPNRARSYSHVCWWRQSFQLLTVAERRLSDFNVWSSTGLEPRKPAPGMTNSVFRDHSQGNCVSWSIKTNGQSVCPEG